MQSMKMRGADRIEGERRLSAGEFLALYNAGLPPGFPRATPEFLRAYEKRYPGQFKRGGAWSLDRHRKKFMDWLPMYLKFERRV